MSVTAETRSGPRSDEPRNLDRICPHCGTSLADDQEWCVECGTATTIIRDTPNWWVAVAVVAAVVLLAVVGFVVALNNSSGGSTPAAVSAPPPVSTPGLTTISEWPAGLTGWTVVLAHSHSEAIAYAKATRVARSGVSAGVIDSSHHPGLVPGYWVVFSGRYSTKQAAKTAAASLLASGHHGAHAKLVAH